MAPSRALLLTMWAWMSLLLASASYIPIPEHPRDLASTLLPHDNKDNDPGATISNSYIPPAQQLHGAFGHRTEKANEQFNALAAPSLPHLRLEEPNQLLRKRSTGGTPRGGSDAGDVPVKMGCFPLTGSIIRSVVYGIPRVVKAVTVCLKNHAADSGFAAANGLANNGAAVNIGALGMMG